MIQEINKELLIYLNSLTKYEFVQSIVMIFSDFPIFFLPIFLVSLWFYYSNKKDSIIVSFLHLKKDLIKKENLLYIFYSVVIWITISLAIQQIINIERPESAIKWAWLLIMEHIPDASFPSDHATVAIAFLTSLFFTWFKKVAFYYMPFVIIMLISRVIVWVHWPLDILAWTIVWIFSSYITFRYLTNLKIINKLNQFIIKIMWYIKM